MIGREQKLQDYIHMLGRLKHELEQCMVELDGYQNETEEQGALTESLKVRAKLAHFQVTDILDLFSKAMQK